MVCLGNICRSPTAEAVFRSHLQSAGLAERVLVDSAGTAAYHQGEHPDSRSIAFAAVRGYDLSSMVARQVVWSDFEQFDYIFAMDKKNLTVLEQMKPEGSKAFLSLFLAGCVEGDQDVPDPYYGGAQGFDEVLDLVEVAADYWLERIKGDLA